MRPVIFLILATILCGSRLYGATFPDSGPTTAGSHAALRCGIALAPASAPLPVKRAIWAANQLRSKPYRYGGGHASFRDSGYDCSGTVSYALGGAGLIPSPMSSSDFRRYGKRGQGRWITVYARKGTRSRSSPVCDWIRPRLTVRRIAGRRGGKRAFVARPGLKPGTQWCYKAVGSPGKAALRSAPKVR